MQRYINSIGIIQNIALGILAAKLYASNAYPPQFVAQAVASFSAIVIIANEYSWWVLLIRRTPSVLDHLIPYGLGVVEFGVMAKVDDLKGTWFWTAGMLATVGALSLIHNRSYAKPDLFSECTWLLPCVRRNLLVNTVLVTVAALVMLSAWYWYTCIDSPFRKNLVFAALDVIQGAMLVITTLFMRGVRSRFEQQ